MSDEMLGALDEIYANANRLVGSVRDDQWDDKTPCSEWNVRDLVQHMSGTSGVCYAAATRTEMDPNAEPGDDPVTEFAAASAAASAAWRGEDALEGMVSVPADMPAIAALGVNIIDIGTHVWDLATALDQDHGLSPEPGPRRLPGYGRSHAGARRRGRIRQCLRSGRAGAGRTRQPGGLQPLLRRSLPPVQHGLRSRRKYQCVRYRAVP